MNKLNWVADLKDKISLNNKCISKVSDIDFEKISLFYLTDGKNRYGFDMNDGIFFINNVKYDLKNKKNNDKLIPFQFKTNKVILQNDFQSIDSYSIGYEIETKNEKYTLKISNEIVLIAERINNDGIKEKKVIKVG